jgi:hypothetical protein
MKYIKPKKYTAKILSRRINTFLHNYNEIINLKNDGVNIRHNPTPEDITENLVVYSLRKIYPQKDIMWSKNLNKKKGDIWINNKNYEVKSFISNNTPIQLRHVKKFYGLYFVDLRNINNYILIWQFNYTYNSNKYLNIKINQKLNIRKIFFKEKTVFINWNYLYPQIKNNVKLIYKGRIQKFIK